MADRVAVMNAGRIEQIGTPRGDLQRPATPFVAEFVGRSNRFEGVIDAQGRLVVDGLDHALAMPPSAIAGRALVIIRPEHVTLRPAAASATGLPATVHDIVFAGDHVDVHLSAGPLRLIAQTTAAPAIGAQVHAEWPLDAARVWPAEG